MSSFGPWIRQWLRLALIPVRWVKKALFLPRSVWGAVLSLSNECILPDLQPIPVPCNIKGTSFGGFLARIHDPTLGTAPRRELGPPACLHFTNFLSWPQLNFFLPNICQFQLEMLELSPITRSTWGKRVAPLSPQLPGAAIPMVASLTLWETPINFLFWLKLLRSAFY